MRRELRLALEWRAAHGGDGAGHDSEGDPSTALTRSAYDGSSPGGKLALVPATSRGSEEGEEEEEEPEVLLFPLWQLLLAMFAALCVGRIAFPRCGMV